MSEALPFTTRGSAIGKLLRRLGRWGSYALTIASIIMLVSYAALYGLASCDFIAAPTPPLYLNALAYFGAALPMLDKILKP